MHVFSSNSLIAPYLTYGIIGWGRACKTHLTKLLILQKRVLHLIFLPIEMTTLFHILFHLRFCQSIFNIINQLLI
jgi:hypothetical protein